MRLCANAITVRRKYIVINYRIHTAVCPGFEISSIPRMGCVLTNHLCQKTDFRSRQKQSVLYIDGLLLHFDMDLFGHTAPAVSPALLLRFN